MEAEYRRHFEQQRLLNQLEALRLNAERTQIMAQLQAMRMGLSGPPRPGLIWRLLGFAAGKVRDYARRALR